MKLLLPKSIFVKDAYIVVGLWQTSIKFLTELENGYRLCLWRNRADGRLVF